VNKKSCLIKRKKISGEETRVDKIFEKIEKSLIKIESSSGRSHGAYVKALRNQLGKLHNSELFDEEVEKEYAAYGYLVFSQKREDELDDAKFKLTVYFHFYKNGQATLEAERSFGKNRILSQDVKGHRRKALCTLQKLMIENDVYKLKEEKKYYKHVNSRRLIPSEEAAF